MVQDSGEERESTTMTSDLMLISIAQPEWFYSESDEDHFFAWLQGIPAVKAYVGTPPQGLDLTVEVPIDRLSFYELVGLLARYQIAKRPLKPLCIGHADSWFTDSKNYWHKDVFG